MNTTLQPSRLLIGDALRTSTVGLRTRRLRSTLSALGITVGIAAMVAVLGLSNSSRSDLLAQLDRLGTNLIRVQAGTGIGFGNAALPDTAPAMVRRIAAVEQVTAQVDTGANVYRSDMIPSDRSGGLTVQAIDVSLLETLRGTIARGRFLDEASARYPVTVLGAIAAERLGIQDLTSMPRVWIEDRWFSVVGILDPFELSPDLDRAALIGIPAAETYLDSDGVASALLVRVQEDQVDAVLGVLAPTVDPQDPDQVESTRPSDAIEAKAAAAGAFTDLLLALGAVALFIGGVGIANIMVISVLERRSEIGLRRALGATRRHVAFQFLSESLLLGAIGGVAGAALGAVIVVAYASMRGWGLALPPVILLAGALAALAIGGLAGFYPAVRASRMSPTEALRTS